MRHCIFCNGRAGSREHLFPEWIIKKVDPDKPFEGFIGHHKNLSFEREWIVRSVCGCCNKGWMSRLETANSRLIGPPINDESISLDQRQQMAVAAWGVKTAMVLDSATKSAKPMFYTQDERRALMSASSIPPRTEVFLGRFLGASGLGGVSAAVTFWGEDVGVPCPVRVSTFLLGHLTLQVVTIHTTPEYGNRAVRINSTKGAWNELLVTCWPTRARNIYWPPVLAFHDGMSGLDFGDLSDRHMIGPEVLL